MHTAGGGACRVGPRLAQLILLNKPYRVLSQFSAQDGRETLRSFVNAPGFYPAGRLDFDSEGLLLLTDDGALQDRIAHPRHAHWKTYLVQVEGKAQSDALERLRAGPTLSDGATLPARVRPIADPGLWSRVPPIRTRQAVPTCWLEVQIREGRNRQVRRMCAAVGHPVLRLVRTAIGPWNLDDLQPGQWRRTRVHLPEARESRTASGKIRKKRAGRRPTAAPSRGANGRKPHKPGNPGQS